MLPDFPGFKAKARALVLDAVRRRVPEVEPLLADIRHTRMHEGQSSRLTRADDSSQEIEMRVGTADLEIPHEQMKSISAEQLVELVHVLASQLAEHQARTMLEAMSKATDEIGNTVSAQEMGLKEAFLESNRKMQVDFDPETKQPVNLVMVLAPAMAESFKKEAEEWEKDPEFVREMAKIRAKQLEDWRARESARQLVD